MNSPAPSSPPLLVESRLGTPSLPRRMASWLYEGMLLFGVAFAAVLLFSLVTQSPDPQAHRHLLMAFLFVVLATYFTWFWAKGQTLAMKTWHIRVVSTTGQALSYPQALVRYLCSWVWFVPPLALAYGLELPPAKTGVLTLGWVWVWAILARFHPEHQFWHDAWAGTRLVTHRPTPQTHRP